MAVRHPVLYDVERWRRYRTLLLLPATVFVMTAILITVLKPQAGSGFGYGLGAIVLVAIAASLWSRSRFTYLACEGDALLVRSLGARQRLTGPEIERVRVVRLSSVFGRPDRRQLLPRPVDRWLPVEAVSITLRPDVDTRKLSRVLGRRGVIDRAVVVPVADPQVLLAELLERVCPPPLAPAGRAGRRRGRRR